MVIVLPYKTTFFPIFGNGNISNHLFIFVHRIKIKNKQSTGIQIIIHQPECLNDILFFQQVIDGITDAYHCTHCTIQFKLSHILQQIQNIQA